MGAFPKAHTLHNFAQIAVNGSLWKNSHDWYSTYPWELFQKNASGWEFFQKRSRNLNNKYFYKNIYTLRGVGHDPLSEPKAVFRWEKQNVCFFGWAAYSLKKSKIRRAVKIGCAPMPVTFVAAAVVLHGIFPVLFLKDAEDAVYVLPASVPDEGARTAIFGQVRAADIPPSEYARVALSAVTDFLDRCSTFPQGLSPFRKGGNQALLLTRKGASEALSKPKAAALQWPAEDLYVHKVAVDIPVITGFATTRYRNEDLLFVTTADDVEYVVPAYTSNAAAVFGAGYAATTALTAKSFACLPATPSTVSDFLTSCSSARGIRLGGIDRLRSHGHMVLLTRVAVETLITADTQVLHGFRWPTAHEYLKLPVAVPAPAPAAPPGPYIDAMDIGDEEHVAAGNSRLCCQVHELSAAVLSLVA